MSPSRERDEVDVPRALRADDAPGAERAGEPERGAAGLLGHGPRGALGVLRHGEVEVDRPPAEQVVAHRAADDPRLLPGEHVAGGVERRLHR